MVRRLAGVLAATKDENLVEWMVGLMADKKVDWMGTYWVERMAELLAQL